MVLKSIHLLYLDITMVNYNRMLRISFNPELQTQDSLGEAWEKFSETKKNNIRHHWKEDIKRHKDYKDAKQGALDKIDKK